VAATYAGNDERAKAFSDRTGVKSYKWDVSSFDECAAGIKQVEADLGPVDVIVNNAGITRDATIEKDEPPGLGRGARYQPRRLLQHVQAAWDGMLARGFGRIVNIGSINGQAGQLAR